MIIAVGETNLEEEKDAMMIVMAKRDGNKIRMRTMMQSGVGRAVHHLSTGGAICPLRVGGGINPIEVRGTILRVGMAGRREVDPEVRRYKCTLNPPVVLGFCMVGHFALPLVAVAETAPWHGQCHLCHFKSPPECQKFQFQPHSKPTEQAQPQASSSIFGGARPVDTLSRQLAAEERLTQKEEEVKKHLKEARVRAEEEEEGVKHMEKEQRVRERVAQAVRREERLPSRSDEANYRRTHERTGSRR